MKDKQLISYIHDDDNKQKLFDIIQSNAAFYCNKWKKHHVPTTFSGWNWAAFFFTPIWLSYRHMYGSVLVYYLLIFFIWSIHTIFPLFVFYGNIDPALAILWTCITTFAVHLYFGLKGNALYARKISSLLFDTSEEKAKVPLFQRTGRSYISAVIVPITFVILLLLPAIRVEAWMDTSTLPYGTYVYYEDHGPPLSVKEALDHELPIFEKYTSTVELLYYSPEPVGDRDVRVVLEFNLEGNWQTIRDRTYTFFRSDRVNLHLLDAEDPLLQTGQYRVTVFMEEEIVGTQSFLVELP
ncbi:DUF2628 domain-containing protein [Evansella cellulosilytica]|uniref:DUF2628 domain-containing protein n=1 Tax=Evansella cellulosilytica (strain ATCC 21833 / DSM 2522 / FERM P-1141 / JCM 9156 / N-4) TaxID=649639 RepID=E6TV12_EVAC2|nr:DUF2628 domain-containing protein [Evansella cellulosilytica]ADU28595.1 hypothetical protein Bcell_0309 [Evansella cellulosilytica DSM 2522]